MEASFARGSTQFRPILKEAQGRGDKKRNSRGAAVRLQDAAANITQLVGELARRCLIRFLPVNASRAAGRSQWRVKFASPIAAAPNKVHLVVFMKEIKAFMQQYEAVGLVKETVKRATDSARLVLSQHRATTQQLDR
ncbi:hypothetical protein CCHL11_03264 [Colletotrichum chlorophyti]|uniref:Uncharacterized protein n=1 Tax=Colletotrichum chlorophyti TaxID=708187 RepID=A0A1Q8S461_9PEZI|nr:hypothetical protein CCHL11_03264 [Colletotrichum chlorophyti]